MEQIVFITMACLLLGAYYVWVLAIKFTALHWQAENRPHTDHYETTLFSIAAEYLGEFRSKVLPVHTPRWLVHTFDVAAIFISPPFVVLAGMLAIGSILTEATGLDDRIDDAWLALQRRKKMQG